MTAWFSPCRPKVEFGPVVSVVNVSVNDDGTSVSVELLYRSVCDIVLLVAMGVCDVVLAIAVVSGIVPLKGKKYDYH